MQRTDRQGDKKLDGKKNIKGQKGRRVIDRNQTLKLRKMNQSKYKKLNRIGSMINISYLSSIIKLSAIISAQIPF